jgi:hypothetical protein
MCGGGGTLRYRQPDRPYIVTALADDGRAWMDPMPLRDLDSLGADDRLLNHLPMVKLVAAQAGAKADELLLVPELVDTGVVALLDAIDRYHVQDERQFAVSARLRVTGAILQELTWRRAARCATEG